MAQLVPGDAFPAISGQRLDGTTIVVPDDLEATPAVLLFYRGQW